MRLGVVPRDGIVEAEAGRLMATARRFSNLPSLEGLPRSVSALYELSRMDPSDIEAGIQSGAMHARVSGTCCGLPWWAF